MIAPEPKGKLTLLLKDELDAQELKFYWADTGKKIVECLVTGDGQPKPGSATLIVEKPTVDPPYTAKQGAVQNVLTKKGEFFGLVQKPGMNAGMEFSATVKIPTGYNPADWQFVQTLVPSAYYVSAAGVKMRHEQNGQTVLDKSVPYAIKGPTLNDGPAGPYKTGNAGGAMDTPGDYLDGTSERSRGRVPAAFPGGEWETYKMYIMFKPYGTNAMWVPLQYLEWSWKGKAYINNMAWSVQGADQSMKAAQDTADHPIWDEKFDGTKWKSE